MIAILALLIPDYMTTTEKPQDIGVQIETEDYKRDLEEIVSG